MARCLCCEKYLPIQPSGQDYIQPDGAGTMKVKFGYGSRHDMLGVYPSDDPKPIEKLLGCAEVVAYICDDCFEQKFNLMHGFSITETVRRDLEFDGA